MPLDPMTASLIASTLVSGGMSLYGNLSGNRDAEDRNNINNQLAREHMMRQEELQREFAKNGISWRVDDARRAGIHPLYALGGSGASYTPTTAVFSDSPPSSSSTIFKGLGEMGQDVTRAVYATSTQKKRDEAMYALSLEHGQLENELLRSQISRMNANSPAFPDSSGMGHTLTGQGNSYPTMVNQMPLNTVMTQPDRPGQDVGSIPDYAFVRTPKGYAVVPSNDSKQRIEDQIVPETMWAIRNLIKPAFSGLPGPDPKYFPLPAGYDKWKWSPMNQEFRPYDSRARDKYNSKVKNWKWRDY